MADQSFERLFAQAAAQVEAQQEKHDPELQKQKRQRTEEDALRKKTEQMTVNDAIKRILLADKDRDYFRMLELPAPDVDALGRPKWEVTPSEISKAYRKLSILVHPDKNPGEEARQAFEVLNKAHRLLKDQGELESILKEHLERAKTRREEEEAKASLEERVILNAKQIEEAKALRKQEAEALNAEIVRQMKEKQERARKRKEAETASRYRRQAEDEAESDGDGDSEEEREKKNGKVNEDGSESDDEAAQRRRQALAKRRRQQLQKKGTL